MNRSSRFIMGRNCIYEVLNSNPDRILKVYTCQKNEDDALYTELQKNKICIKRVSKGEIAKMVNSESHQSYVASVKEIPNIHIRDFIEESQNKDQSLVLMLDSIYDPQNLGTIMRAAECFGVDLVIYSKNRGSDITPTVTKTSAGATELVPIAKVSNLADTMLAFQKADYWAGCADVGKRSKSLYEFEFPEKTLLIMGSEGEGVRPLLKKKCDFHISIPMLGQIDSLNVSQATAVLLNSYRSVFSSY
ncbi:23S rRNA (guanosine(2251)-2'-O)-methyltransferase RlmB [Candidatus Aerophobetes bacterium]|uniref:23S rRNA (Guanosine(2251)-2'-O)-methyltransferase RlmB n=1 Tax=Aerophobetes bacterium TaxID=2030807 RepID=A0A2A4YHC8_UNCAE|nr:MAG: 23S rRNA (guanosine(2251)-2'-O)-methyltransferase RlmB [Candidatus Aerophobetes bacterium]